MNTGINGEEVRSVQEYLFCLGYFPEGVVVNGVCSPTTKASVQKFQSINAIEPFGYIGPATRAVLNSQ
ncbi:MAG: peptidoglycan-binding domain-containing protein [Candidatus Magasanikbacteria bacterium]